MSINYDDIMAAVYKAVGENDDVRGVTRWLSTGFLPLDQAVSGLQSGGGLPSGRLIEIAGPPSAGKTALATQVMIAAQRQGGVAAFHDHERSFDAKLAERLGLEMSPSRLIFRRPRTLEDSILSFMNTARAIRSAKAFKDIPLVWVFDSIASMVPQSQLEKEITKQGMNDQSALARALSLHLKVLAVLAEELDVCLVFLNQTRMKLGIAFGDPTTTAGGDASKFYFSVRIMLSASRITKGVGEDQEIVGFQVTGRTIKNKVNRPFLKAKWHFMFREDGSGYFDTAGSLIDTLVARGVLSAVKNTGRIEWVDGSKPYRTELIEKINAAPNGIALLEKLLIKSGVVEEVDEEAAKNAMLAAAASAEAEGTNNETPVT